MNRFIFFFLIPVFFAFSAKPIENLYDILFTTLNGTEESMYTLEGQKVLIVVLPGKIRHRDNSLLRRIGKISLQYSSQFRVLAVPSNEDGFVLSDALVEWYSTYLGGKVKVTTGMNTASGSEQSPLFSWLTASEQNGHFSKPVSGVGHLFFISENAELIAVLDKETTLSDELIEHLLAL